MYAFTKLLHITLSFSNLVNELQPIKCFLFYCSDGCCSVALIVGGGKMLMMMTTDSDFHRQLHFNIHVHQFQFRKQNSHHWSVACCCCWLSNVAIGLASINICKIQIVSSHIGKFTATCWYNVVFISKICIVIPR